jgi:hemin uptake protein HemP
MAGTRPVLADAVAASRAQDERASAPPGRPVTASPARRWRSAELFGAGHEIEIEHGPAIYRLRLTSMGKLILTK